MIAKKVVWYETIAVLFMCSITWINEIFDIPYVFLGGPSTPINWRESVFESIVIAMIGAVIIRYTYNLLIKISYLEQILPVCASCKKIRIDAAFLKDIQHFVDERTAKDFTYGICPDCIKTYYPELHGKKRPPTNGAE
jgi:hypothetical protein